LLETVVTSPLPIRQKIAPSDFNDTITPPASPPSAPAIMICGAGVLVTTWLPLNEITLPARLRTHLTRVTLTSAIVAETAFPTASAPSTLTDTVPVPSDEEENVAVEKSGVNANLPFPASVVPQGAVDGQLELPFIEYFDRAASAPLPPEPSATVNAIGLVSSLRQKCEPSCPQYIEVLSDPPTLQFANVPG